MSQAQRRKRPPTSRAHSGADVRSRSVLSHDAVLLAILLVAVAVAVLAAHWPALAAKAISFDDNQYLVDNYLVQHPSWRSAGRFLGEVLEPSTVAGYYQPLAMISLMFDAALGGRTDDLRPFHRTSLALHVANTVLVIVFLYMLFGQPWIAVIVGLLFGVHPLTVEPIPWVGERKTLLAAFFALWCLILYVRYTRRHATLLYALCLAAYVLALLSKPTSTPLAVALLLLDFWPLARLSRRAVLEKVPFFIIAAISSVITFVSQARTAAVEVPGEYSPLRIPLTLCHNIVFYLYKIIWPVRLSSHYPFPDPMTLSAPMVLAGVIGTVVLIVVLLVSLRWTRALLTGWLFFFVTIFPTMGIIGFTNVIASDKYAYLPSLGLLLPLTWFLSRAWLAASHAGSPPAIRGGIVLAALVLVGAEVADTRLQQRRWQDTETLYRHMLSLAPQVASLHNGLGYGLAMTGRPNEAIAEYTEALRLDPEFYPAHYNLGIALLEKRRFDEAIRHFREAIHILPTDPRMHNNLALALAQTGQHAEAIAQLTDAARLNPDDPEIRYNLANTLADRGRLDEAVKYYDEAVRLEPRSPRIHTNFGNALGRQGKLDEAIGHYNQALAADPDFLPARINLGNAFRTQGKADQALAAYREAVRSHPEDVTANLILGMALQDQGRLDEAIEQYQRLLQIAPTNTQVRERLNAAIAQRRARATP